MKKLYLLLAFFLLVILAPVWYFNQFYTAPAQSYVEAVTLNIVPGMPAKKIVEELAARKLIRSQRIFEILLRLQGLTRQLKAGEYEFNTRMSAQEIMAILKQGRVKLYPVTLPEGLTVKEVASILASKHLVEYEEFTALANSPAILKKYEIPWVNSEGYLYPDTYLFSKGVSTATVLETILDHFGEVYNARWQKVLPQNLSRHQLIILASIVEKEAKKDEERPLIAAVFFNRLEKNMRLESCATIIYALGHHVDSLTDDDLFVDSPYNTYRHPGLPPGPICNPGALSIEAVLHPSAEDYLYFVAGEDGGHHFSKTFAEHVQAKQERSVSLR